MLKTNWGVFFWDISFDWEKRFFARKNPQNTVGTPPLPPAAPTGRVLCSTRNIPVWYTPLVLPSRDKPNAPSFKNTIYSNNLQTESMTLNYIKKANLYENI